MKEDKKISLDPLEGEKDYVQESVYLNSFIEIKT